MASSTLKAEGNCIANYYYLKASEVAYHLPKFNSMGVLFVCTNNQSDIYNMRVTHIESIKNLDIVNVTVGTDTLNIVVNNSCACIYLHD